jgi:predicted ribosome quality control (RQC) complex YloA/Tae2 family protein
MSLDAREIEQLVAELAPLAGARVEEVRVHAERALTLELFTRGGPVLLLLSAEADVTRLHVARRRPPGPDEPFPFQPLLRRELTGGRLATLELLPGDRVVSLGFETAKGPQRLVAELTGRHGNLLLLAPDGTVRATAGRNPSQRHSLSSQHRLLPGQLYQPPAPGPGGVLHARFVPEPGADPFPLSAAVERHYAALEEERLLGEARRRLREPVRAGVARAGRTLAKLADEAARVPAAEADRRTADLLKQNLHRVKRGDREVTVTEWTEQGPHEVTLALDPALPPQASMERHYRRYRRIVESAARVEARTAEVRAQQTALRALLAEVEEASLAELPRLEREARKLGAGPRPPPRPRRKDETPALPYRTFRSVAGAAILVGKGASENDALTRRHARGNDLWLHVRGVPGAHVVVRMGKASGPDQETLLDAAHLAAHFSDARGTPQLDVAWTRVKWVKKPKGAAPGVVTYHQEKVLGLRLEPGRIERLLAEEEVEA